VCMNVDKGLLSVKGSFVHWESGSVLETLQDGDVITVDRW